MLRQHVLKRRAELGLVFNDENGKGHTVQAKVARRHCMSTDGVPP
jgi:hypothetical protein